MGFSELQYYNSNPPLWYWILVIAILAFTIVTRWFLYRKAGEHGWAAVIPFYSQYCLFRAAGKKKLFIPWLVLTLGTIVLTFAAMMWLVSAVVLQAVRIFSPERAFDPYEAAASIGAGMFVLIIIFIAIAIVFIVINVFVMSGISHNFGHGAGFTVGLFFLPPIFMAILAFGKSTHMNGGHRTDDDGQAYGGWAQNAPFTNVTCSVCGTRFFHDDSAVMPGQTFVCFCPGCGTQLQFVKR